jgi:hypothetical protein
MLSGVEVLRRPAQRNAADTVLSVDAVPRVAGSGRNAGLATRTPRSSVQVAQPPQASHGESRGRSVGRRVTAPKTARTHTRNRAHTRLRVVTGGWSRLWGFPHA